MAGRKDGRWVGKTALAIALIAPAIVFGAAVAIRLFPMPRTLPFDILVMVVGKYAAWVAAAVAVLAFVHAFGNLRRRLPWTLAAMLMAALSAGIYLRQSMIFAEARPADVSSNPAEPPADEFASVAMTSSSCEGLEPLPSQITSEQASEALQAVGFTINKSGLFSVHGYRQAFWFREVHNAGVRIRPGRTDIRVVSWDKRYDGGASCRLALRLRAELQARR